MKVYSSYDTLADECDEWVPAAEIDRLERELAEMTKQRDGYAQQSDERWVTGDAALLRVDRLERERRELQGRIAMALDAKDCCVPCMAHWLIGALDAGQKTQVEDAARKGE